MPNEIELIGNDIKITDVALGATRTLTELSKGSHSDHDTRHEEAGDDEVDPALHASKHENAGDDEINVGGLSGELADNQPPKDHASAHQSGGGDAIKLDDLSAPDDNTDLDASNAKHGLMKKFTDVANNFLNASGAFAEAVVLAAAQTLTNKRITKRVDTIASSATPTPAGDTTDIFTVTALAEAAEFAAPTGTPTNGQTLIIRILDNGTARALTWNAIYRGIVAALPDTTVADKTLYMGFSYNLADTKYDLLAVADEV